MTDNQNTNTQGGAAAGASATPEQQAPALKPTMTRTRTYQTYDQNKGWHWVEEKEEVPVEDEPKVERESDVSDKEGGEKDGEERQDQDQERKADATPEALGLQVPEVLEGLQRTEVEGYVEELAPMIAEAGVDPGEVNMLLAHATDLVLTDPSGVDLLNRDACEAHARNYFGESFERTVDAAQRAADKLGPKFKDWLRAGGKGNHVGVISALAAYESGMLRMSPESAQTELKKMFEPGSAYMKGDRNAVNRARLLNELANRKPSKAAPATTTMRPAPDPSSALATERRKLMESPAFLDAKHREHAATMARYREITERMYGGA